LEQVPTLLSELLGPPEMQGLLGLLVHLGLWDI
jgi:hypothetical protein